MKYFKRILPGFDYSIALSRENVDPYNFGYVHQVYLNAFKKYDERRKFYICGWTQMVDEAVVHLLKDLKYKPSQVKYELYG